tara:strand:+ start:103 stop:363 length:261 start_codon:yes stop_codon:yes gene_type:complete
MFINSLLACFVLLASGADNQCVAEDQAKKTQAAQSQTEDYMPAVIYFTTQELSLASETPGLKEVINVGSGDREEDTPIVQTFIIKR